MTLNQWASSTKRAIFDELNRGLSPSVGEYDAALLNDGKAKGQPQMGATVYSPDSARFEFAYADAGSTIVVSVRVPSPQRIVFLPVPDWVVETIWQGDIDGSYHFEADALALVEAYRGRLGPEANAALFGPKPPTRRE